MTVAMDAMAVAIHIKYALSLKRHITFYWRQTDRRHRLMRPPIRGGVITRQKHPLDPDGIKR